MEDYEDLVAKCQSGKINDLEFLSLIPQYFDLTLFISS